MNVAVFILIFSFSFTVTVKGLNRIPIKRTYGDDYPEERIDDDNPQIQRQLEVYNDTKDDETTSTTKKDNRELKFTDFILEAAKVLKSYEDKVLELAFAIINGEVCKDVNKGCKAHELDDIGKYASDQLILLKDAPADKIRQHLNYIINILTRDDFGDIRDLADYVNSLYVGESEKFIEILLALVHRRISDDVDLAATLKDALNTLIFNHYCNLDNQVRHELIKMIKHYWSQFISKVSDKNSLSKDYLPFVTPFVSEISYKDTHKKRRFNKVISGKPLVKRWKDNSKSGEYINTSGNKPTKRANSVEQNEEHLKSIESDVVEESRLYKYSRTRANSTEDTTESGNLESSIIRPSTPFITSNKSPKIKKRVVEDKSKNTFRQSNSTIDKLISIGTLAKEINDMIASEGKAMRKGGSVMHWDSYLHTAFGDLMIGGEQVTTCKPNEQDERKDVVISMQAKYQE